MCVRVSLEQFLMPHPNWPSLSCVNSAQWLLKPSELVHYPGQVSHMSRETLKTVLTRVESDRLRMGTTVPHPADPLPSQEQWETGGTAFCDTTASC